MGHHGLVAAAVIDPRGGAARGLRALLLALTAVAVAGAAHTAAAGCVDLLGLALALGTCWPAAVALLGRRRRLPVLLAWTTGAQAVTHVLLATTCGAGWHVVPAPALAAHAAAVVVTTALLHRADAALWVAHVLRRAATRWLRRPTAPVLPSLPRHAPIDLLQACRQIWQAPPRPGRGPPSVLLPTS
jgi:hypothetical protein